MKEIKYETWIDAIKQLNANQPSLMDLVNRSIESYEKDKAENEIKSE